MRRAGPYGEYCWWESKMRHVKDQGGCDVGSIGHVGHEVAVTEAIT
jgi:hypothetical protein